MINTDLAIAFYCPHENLRFGESAVIAKDLGIPVIEEETNIDSDVHYVLFWQNVNNSQYLSIASPQAMKKNQGLYVDYINSLIAGKTAYKFNYLDALPKAMGLAKLKDQKVRIIDGTAGFTLDAYALLQLCNNLEFTLVEQSKILFYLVNDGISRLRNGNGLHLERAQRMQIINDNFISYCKSHSKSHSKSADYQIIYLDPMFEKTKSSAAPKQNMQLLQDLCKNPNDVNELLSVALDYQKATGGGKVVLKRSGKQPKLLEKNINFSVESKQIRYDVYLI